MKIGIEGTPYDVYGLDRYKKMKEHGWDACDFQWFLNTETELFKVSDEEFEARLKAEKALADEAGIEFYQVHGPWKWPSSDDTEEGRAERWEKFAKSIKGASFLGAKYIVIHPIMPFGHKDIDPDFSFELNVNFFKSLMPVARQYGVKIGYENMPFQRHSIALPVALLRVIEAVNDEYFTFCLDTGHCSVFNYYPTDALRLMKKHLTTLHIHDNDGTKDQHRCPGNGVIKWEEFVRVLHEIDFGGVVSFENSFKVDEKPETPEGYDAKLREFAAIAKRMADGIWE